jgi:hypothetical protein
VKTFVGAREAARQIGGAYPSLINACREKKNYKGYKWRYKE